MPLPSDLGFIRARSATERLQDLHSAGCCLRFSPLTVLLSSGLASPPGASHGNKPHSASYWLSMSFTGSDRWQSITRWAEGKKSVATFKCRPLFFKKKLDLSLKAENFHFSDKQTAPAQLPLQHSPVFPLSPCRFARTQTHFSLLSLVNLCPWWLCFDEPPERLQHRLLALL